MLAIMPLMSLSGLTFSRISRTTFPLMWLGFWVVVVLLFVFLSVFGLAGRSSL
jgi:hypothetical protein